MTAPNQPTVVEPEEDQRREVNERFTLAGVAVREEDIEPVKGIRTIAVLFRGMAIVLLLLMAFQLFFGLTGTVPTSIGVLLADAVRLIIFAGLLWGAGDVAVLIVKSHYDLRATRILTARIAYMMRHDRERNAELPRDDGRDDARRAP